MFIYIDIQTITFTTGVSAATSLVTAFLTTLVVNKLKKGQEAADKLQLQKEDRLNPDKNIVREYEELTSAGVFQDKIWHVNPHWISYVDGMPRIRSWEGHTLHETRIGPNPQNPSELVNRGYYLLDQSVERAKQKREWLVMYEIVESLTLRGFKPCKAEEGHLFQPLPD